MEIKVSGTSLSGLISLLEYIQANEGDLDIGFEDDDSYTNICTLKKHNNDLIFDISKTKGKLSYD